MFLITCPFCGEREQSEFKAGGEAHIERPKQPTELSDDEWAEYLFMRKNIKGIQFERWNHAHGCRKWFNVVRDTSNDKIKASIEQLAQRQRAWTAKHRKDCENLSNAIDELEHLDIETELEHYADSTLATGLSISCPWYN